MYTVHYVPTICIVGILVLTLGLAIGAYVNLGASLCLLA